MNSLNLLSARVIGQSPSEKPSNYRRRSFSEGNLSKASGNLQPRRSASQHVKRESSSETLREKETLESDAEAERATGIVTPLTEPDLDEQSPLLDTTKESSRPDSKNGKLYLVARKLVRAIFELLQSVLSPLTTSGYYIATLFHDDAGHFSPFQPIQKLRNALPNRNKSRSTAQAVGLSAAPTEKEKVGLDIASNDGTRKNTSSRGKSRRSEAAESLSHTDSIRQPRRSSHVLQESEAKSRTSSSDEMTPARRSIRIKLYNEDTAKKRKSKKSSNNEASSNSAAQGDNHNPALTIATIKSPTSPTSSLRMTKYPRAPAPPRPLIPLQQPSYSTYASARSASRLSQKTLVIDLDETLIHSLAKGGRMSSGHMVEVKLNTAVGYAGTTLGPQHPILYYVHKRPYCDEFLRKVCKWYNLVVFTASVQEYADPVIDWLEQERKYFAGRYYRQHCTFRNGAYVKDLSSIEPDLSKVIIIDNSPLSYIFHEGK